MTRAIALLALLLAGCGAEPCRPAPCDAAGRYAVCVADELQTINCRALGAMCEDGAGQSTCRFPEPTP